MNPKTEKIMNEMVAFAKAGNDVIPMFFQPRVGFMRGVSANVGAAVRCAKKRGLLVDAGFDGNGCPVYRAPVPGATHVAPTTVQ